MKGIFRLIAADVFEVQSLERVEGFLVSGRPEIASEAPSLAGHRSEVRGLQWVSERINRATRSRDAAARFARSARGIFYVPAHQRAVYDEPCGKLVTLASRGYGESGIGARYAWARV